MCFFAHFKINHAIKKLTVLRQARTHNQPSDEMLKKEMEGYHHLAHIYKSLIGKKKYPFAREMELECYRAAANIEDIRAQYILGKTLLDEANCRHDLQQKPIFANPSNERQMHTLYEEALAYLLAAEKLGHIEAKRLRGLCYINGWGVAPDKEAGFDLVMASIAAENSWDRVPQIFMAMGLNKPEFFAALTEHRGQLGQKQ